MPVGERRLPEELVGGLSEGRDSDTYKPFPAPWRAAAVAGFSMVVSMERVFVYL